MRDANNQAIAYVYSGATVTDALQAKVLTESGPCRDQCRAGAAMAKAFMPAEPIKVRQSRSALGAASPTRRMSAMKTGQAHHRRPSRHSSTRSSRAAQSAQFVTLNPKVKQQRTLRLSRAASSVAV